MEISATQNMQANTAEKSKDQDTQEAETKLFEAIMESLMMDVTFDFIKENQ